MAASASAPPCGVVSSSSERGSSRQQCSKLGASPNLRDGCVASTMAPATGRGASRSARLDATTSRPCWICSSKGKGSVSCGRPGAGGASVRVRLSSSTHSTCMPAWERHALATGEIRCTGAWLRPVTWRLWSKCSSSASVPPQGEHGSNTCPPCARASQASRHARAIAAAGAPLPAAAAPPAAAPPPSAHAGSGARRGSGRTLLSKRASASRSAGAVVVSGSVASTCPSGSLALT